MSAEMAWHDGLSERSDLELDLGGHHVGYRIERLASFDHTLWLLRFSFQEIPIHFLKDIIVFVFWSFHRQYPIFTKLLPRMFLLATGTSF
jgi:hypothetical protein